MGCLMQSENLIIALYSTVGAQHMDAFFYNVAHLKWYESCVLP